MKEPFIENRCPAESQADSLSTFSLLKPIQPIIKIAKEDRSNDRQNCAQGIHRDDP